MVNQARDNFLADAGFAGNEHFGVGARRALDVGFNETDGFAATDETDIRRTG